MAALIGNLMISNIATSISPTTSTGISNGSSQILPGLVTATATLGSGNYTYQWNQSGTAITFTNATNTGTNCTYASLSVAGSTTIYCTVTDTWTGIQSITGNCVITWPVQSVTQNVVISGTVTYNGAAQSYTLTGTPATPAPSGTPASFTAAGTYVYPTNITSITAGSGYTLGTVSGSFVINRLTITAMSFTLNGVAFTSNQTGTAGTTYTIAVSSVTPSGATYSPTSVAYSTAGAYSLSSSGTGNYTGTFTSPTLTINAGPTPIVVTLPPTIAAGNVTPQTITVTSVTGGSGVYSSAVWSRTAFTGTGTPGLISGTITSATANRGSITIISTTYQLLVTDNLGATGSGSITIIWNIA
jgi:large repetitive protein